MTKPAYFFLFVFTATLAFAAVFADISPPAHAAQLTIRNDMGDEDVIDYGCISRHDSGRWCWTWRLLGQLPQIFQVRAWQDVNFDWPECKIDVLLQPKQGKARTLKGWDICREPILRMSVLWPDRGLREWRSD